MTSTRVAELLAELTLDEKAALTAGTDLWRTPPVERLGLGVMKLTDGPIGARGDHYMGGPSSACFPCGSALAATFDTELVGRVGEALGREVRAKGAHVLLGPTVNLHRSPLGGRHFECYSEDPHLTAQLAVAYIRGVQSQGVGACIKHFVANESEYERFTMSSEVDARTLREVYLRPFEAAVHEAGVWSIMAAYNRLNGTHCSEHPWLLSELLRDEWGWTGFVVSDWGATHSTAPAASAGLDLEMPGPGQHLGGHLAAAVRAGEVDEAIVDDRARALLTGLDRAGLLDGSVPGGETAEELASGDSPEVRALAREAAASSVVLLRNDGVLPLDPSALRRVAVIGPNAAAALVQGGGSAGVAAPYAVSPLAGITAHLGDAAEVVYEPGVVSSRSIPRIESDQLRSPSGDAGFLVEYFANRDLAGQPVRAGVARRSTFLWSGQVRGGDPDDWSLRMTADYVPHWSGEHTFSLTTTGRTRVWVAGELAVDAWDDDTGRGATGTSPETTRGGRPVLAFTTTLDAGLPVPLVVELAVAPGRPDHWLARTAFDLRCRQPVPDDLLPRAVAAAREADVAVVVVGLDSEWETEGRDRTTLALPPGQDELVEAVRAANQRTVVVVNAGAPLAMPWAGDVPSLVWLWYSGQEQGNALADVLFGAVNPSGRLPTTFPKRLEDTPSFATYPGTNGKVRYAEGVLVGHRWYESRGIEPAFPFGHGLSYTRFEYGPLDVMFEDGERGAVDLRFSLEVTNAGDRAGHEVVQVYLRDVESSVWRPPKELKAFTRVHLEPRETKRVELVVPQRELAFWDLGTGAWTIEPGEFEVLAGASSADIRSRATFEIG